MLLLLHVGRHFLHFLLTSAVFTTSSKGKCTHHTFMILTYFICLFYFFKRYNKGCKEKKVPCGRTKFLFRPTVYVFCAYGPKCFKDLYRNSIGIYHCFFQMFMKYFVTDTWYGHWDFQPGFQPTVLYFPTLQNMLFCYNTFKIQYI